MNAYRCCSYYWYIIAFISHNDNNTSEQRLTEQISLLKISFAAFASVDRGVVVYQVLILFVHAVEPVGTLTALFDKKIGQVVCYLNSIFGMRNIFPHFCPLK